MKFWRRRAGVAAAAVAILVLAVPAPARAAPGHARIEGTGSSWSANAVNQWVADVAQQGMEVVYTSTGSATGRRDFRYGTNDFAVSDIGFQGHDPLTGQEDLPGKRPFVYLPIVAGGTSFPYQIKVGGQLVRNLRLSGETIAKIFTNAITNWNDAQITADNNGRVLPSLPIIPVVHSEGSGATFQFTRYLATQYQSIWSSWAGRAAPTEYYPATKPGALSSIVPQNGSDGVMNFLSAASGNGSIGYDEYSYALNINYPVAKVKNVNGYFTLPSDNNVAVSMTSAIINEDKASADYLLQDLHSVYTQADNRTYPLSSYSYLVLPVGAAGDANEPRVTTGKRQTLADFLSYSICAGQNAMGPLGYSPLPINLVQAGFDQIKKLSTADSSVVVSQQPVDKCHNPTFVPGQPTANYLAQHAPMPAACDKVDAGPCAATTARAGGSGGGSGSGSAGGSGSGPGSGGGSGAGSDGGSGGGGASTGGTGSTAGTATSDPNGATAAPQIDPDTGQQLGSGAASDAQAVGTPTDLAGYQTPRLLQVLGPLAAVLVAGVLFLPPLLGRWLAARRRDPS